MPKVVEYKEFQNFLNNHNIPYDPEVDNSMDDRVTEDFWNESRTQVVAWINYFNGSTCYWIAPERLT